MSAAKDFLSWDTWRLEQAAETTKRGRDKPNKYTLRQYYRWAGAVSTLTPPPVEDSRGFADVGDWWGRRASNLDADAGNPL